MCSTPAVGARYGERRRAGCRARAVATLLLLTLLMPVGAAEVFRWVDDAGQVHFGDRPPASGAEQLTVPSSAPEQAASGARLEHTRRLLEAFAAERADRREQRAEEAARKAARKQRCTQARRNRAGFENASRVVRYDDAGNRIVLDGEDYEAAHRRVLESVERWCDRS